MIRGPDVGSQQRKGKPNVPGSDASTHDGAITQEMHYYEHVYKPIGSSIVKELDRRFSTEVIDLVELCGVLDTRLSALVKSQWETLGSRISKILESSVSVWSQQVTTHNTPFFIDFCGWRVYFRCRQRALRDHFSSQAFENKAADYYER